MRVRILLVPAVFVVAIGLVACSAAPASHSPTTPAATIPLTGTPGASTASSATSGDLTASAGPTGSGNPAASQDPNHVAPDLEALLPGELSDTTLSKSSQNGEAILDSFTRVMTTFLASVGKTPADLQVAETADATSTLDLSVYAFRVNGVAAQALRQAITDGLMAGSSGLTTTTRTLSGKGVTELVAADESASNVYLYEHDAVVFVIITTDETLASSVLATLP